MGRYSQGVYIHKGKYYGGVEVHRGVDKMKGKDNYTRVYTRKGIYREG